MASLSRYCSKCPLLLKRDKEGEHGFIENLGFRKTMDQLFAITLPQIRRRPRYGYAILLAMSNKFPKVELHLIGT